MRNTLAYRVTESITTVKLFVEYIPRGLYYKTFYGGNLKIFVISENVCPWQAFPA
jgi:hypothetical protein